MRKKITILKTMLFAIAMMVGSGSAFGQGTESFTHASNSSSYTTINWTGTNGLAWSSADSRGDQIIATGNKAICIRQTAGKLTGLLTPSQITAGVGVITFNEKNTASTADNAKATTYQFKCGSTTKTITVPAMGTSSQIVTSPEINSLDAQSIEITITGLSGVRITIDDLSWTAATVSSAPTLTITPSTLNSFSYNSGSGPSAEQSFTVSGANLTNDVSVALPTNYEISTGTGASFVPASVAIPITMATANAGATTIYTRLKAGLPVAIYNEDITISSTAATSKTVACTGNVACVPSGIAFGTSTINKSVGNAAFTQIPTSSSSAAITYSSSAEVIATVNANTGEVSILTAGTATITATQVAGSGYCGSSATYTLNVASTAPTITVSEVSVPAMTAVVGNTDSKTITVSGSNLTTNIDVALSGTNANQFSLSTNTVAQTAGTAASTTVTITYTPTAAGTHTAAVTLTSAGATTVTFDLTASATWPPLSTPVATGANGVNDYGFTANWDAVTGATSYDLDVYTKTGGGITTETEAFNNVTPNGNLIGSGTYLTGWSVSSQGTRQIYTTTGNFGVAAPSFAFTTTADFIETATYVSPITSISFWVKQQSGATSSTLIEGYNGSTWSTIATLSNADVATAGTKTYDLATLGKTDIVKIKMTYTKVAGNLSIDDIAVNSGSAAIKTSIAGYPVTGITDNFKTVIGLTPSSSYFYTVTAKNANVSSSVSNEIFAPTTPITGLNNVNSTLSVIVLNGNIQLNALAGETVNIYNTVGQQLSSKVTVEGLNTISVAARGVIIVKVGSRVAKVIM